MRTRRSGGSPAPPTPPPSPRRLRWTPRPIPPTTSGRGMRRPDHPSSAAPCRRTSRSEPPPTRPAGRPSVPGRARAADAIRRRRRCHGRPRTTTARPDARTATCGTRSIIVRARPLDGRPVREEDDDHAGTPSRRAAHRRAGPSAHHRRPRPGDGDDIAGLFADALPRVFAKVAAVGATPASPAFGRYHEFTPDDVDVEIGVGVGSAPGGLASLADCEPGEVGASELPGGPAAVVTHVGPYNTLSATYERLHDWIHEQDREEGPARGSPTWTTRRSCATTRCCGPRSSGRWPDRARGPSENSRRMDALADVLHVERLDPSHEWSSTPHFASSGEGRSTRIRPPRPGGPASVAACCSPSSRATSALRAKRSGWRPSPAA